MSSLFLLISMAGVQFEVEAAVEQHRPQDSCATNVDKYQCHYNIECIWCEKPGIHGRCMNWTGHAQAGETCDPLIGCSGHRTQTLCDKDANCKWCSEITQGWPFCSNITTDHRGAATCDKVALADPTITQDVSHPLVVLAQEPTTANSNLKAAVALEQEQPQDSCARNSDKYQCHYNIECIWCEKQGNHGRCMNWTSRPQSGETCDPLVGCSGHRTQTLCDKDANCKWCTDFTQGWPFCSNITEDHRGAATCDKATPPQDRCATNSDKYQCHYNIECIWCEKSSGQGRCMNWTGHPQSGETCDPLVGCSGHRTQTLCDKDANCKWCTEITQGWPFCSNITAEHKGAATCDKAATAQDVLHPLVAGAQEPAILELSVENKAHSFGKSLYIARGSSGCWGIPGLAPQMDGSYNLVPDEQNTACPCRKGSSCDFASSILLGFNFDYSWDVLHKFERQAAQVKWMGRGNRTKDGSIAWTYSCNTLSGSDSSWKVTCRERPPKHSYAKLGYTVTIEDLAAAPDYSSSLFLM